MTLALCPWKPVNGLVYEKELLPVGPVTKWVNGDKQVTDVDVKLSFLERVVSQFKKFKEVGVRVPLFKSHIEDVDNDRGTVEDVFVRENESGVPSLYGRIAFSTEEAAKQGSQVDVSVMCPPKFIDGKGNAYDFPLRHVALTSIPVVPNLEPFRAVVFSFDDALTSEEGLLLDAEDLGTVDTGIEDAADELADADALILIADLLGVDLSKGNRDIVGAVTVLKGGEQPPEDEVALEEPVAIVASQEPIVLSHRVTEQLVEARKAQIAALVTERVISPALATKWTERYTTPEVIALDFSAELTGTTSFQDAVETARELAVDKPISAPPRRNVVALSHDADPDANLPATVRDAKKRAAAAAQRKA
jgi:hypothetical protein